MYPNEMVTAAMQQLERDAAQAQRAARAQLKERKAPAEERGSIFYRLLHFGAPRSRAASPN
jgi:hypothetical protein